MTVIAINNNKGGVLKTTININLAGVLALEGKKVLIVDLDNQGNVALSFGINPDDLKYTIYDVLIDGLPPEVAIRNVYTKKAGKIDILPANDELTFFDFDVIGDQQKFKQPFYLLRDRLKLLEKEYDYILIDSMPSLGLMTGNILSFADYVLIPFQPESYSMRSLTKILTAIKQFKENHNGKLEVLGVLGTLVDQRTNLHNTILQEARKYCLENDINMFETVIPKSVRFANSVAYEAVPATLVDSKNNAVKKYFDLWEEIKQYDGKKT